ncbi:MAG: hypothetical protein HYV26_05615 [Candidatus Hydrogenedentes bacterium]|nr:hypothetical protein [Candidatus Hydrogenedentota bacterium]
MWSQIHVPHIYPEYLSDLKVLICPSGNFFAEEPFPQTYRKRIHEGWAGAGADIAASGYQGLAAQMIAAGGSSNDDPCDGGAGDSDGQFDPQSPWCYVRATFCQYRYWGWAVPGDRILCVEDSTAMADEVDGDHAELQYEWDDFDMELPHTSAVPAVPAEDVTVHWIREGIERFFITDINNAAASSEAQSEVVVSYDNMNFDTGDISAGDTFEGFNHIPGGSNVLFMDGHVEFAKYPGDLWIVDRVNMSDGTLWFP